MIIYQFVLVICILISQGQCQRLEDIFESAKFQSDSIPSTNSFIVAQATFPRMDEISMCTHLKLYHARGPTIPLASYSVDKFPDELSISYGVQDETVHFICCKGEGRYDSERLNISRGLLTYVHMCITIDLKNNDLTFYINDIVHTGKVAIVGTSSSIYVQGGGIFVLGQEQDETMGGFSIIQSFEGSLTDYVFDNTIFDLTTIKSLINCQGTSPPGSLISFTDLENNWSFHGSVEIENVTDRQLCNENTKYSIFFPEPRSRHNAFSLCNMLKGKVAVPENELENAKIVMDAQNFTSICSNGLGIFLWVGVRASNISGIWQMVDDETNKSLAYTNFRPGFSQIHGNFKCAYFDTYEIGYWTIYPCESTTCVACSFDRFIPLRLKGLCRNSLIDRNYVLNGYHDMKPKLVGMKHSEITYINGTWTLMDSVFAEILGIMETIDLNPYPFGLRKWTIVGDVCQETTLNLLLTSCQPHQYTCNDGTCIPKMQRCDLQVQCPDQSDETLCTVVVVPADYIKQVPPARIGKDPAAIAILMTILAVQPIEILAMMLKIEVLITLKWRDPRLDMESLNYADSMNVIHVGNSVWQPSYQMEDASGSETLNTLHWETFSAVMESGPLDDDITRSKEDEVYPGSSNSLKLVQSYSIKFSCRMQLVGYPFDTQHCSLIIRLQDVPKEFVILKAAGLGVEFVGSPGLREYYVTEATMVSHNRANFSGYMVTITLENLSGFYVFSTYIPTFLMVAICYSTVFFDIDDFNDRIMVSLTALLVLATFFTQINQTTPKTAYLKLLDVWFVSCIMMDFSIVILHVLINIVKMDEEGDNSAISPVLSYKKKFVERDQFQRTNRYNGWAKRGLPIVIGLFVVGYIVVSRAFIL